MSFVSFYVPEHLKAQPPPKGSTGGGSGFKVTHKRGHGFKSYPKHTGRVQDSWAQDEFLLDLVKLVEQVAQWATIAHLGASIMLETP